MTTKLDCFTQWVAQAAEQGVTPARCTALMGLIAQPQGLAESFQRQSPRKAAGMDGVRNVNSDSKLIQISESQRFKTDTPPCPFLRGTGVL